MSIATLQAAMGIKAGQYVEAGSDVVAFNDVELGDKNEFQVPVRINGYTGAVFHWPDFGGDSIFDLAGIEAPTEVPLLVDHENAVKAHAGMGVPLNDGRGITAAGTLAVQTSAGKEVLAGHRGGNKYQASVRITPQRLERIAPGKTIQINGRSVTAGAGGLAVVRKGRLREITITPLGRDSDTSVDIAASESTSQPAAVAATIAGASEMDPAATQDVQASDNAAVTTQNAADVTTNHAPTLSLADVQAAISKGIAEGTKAIRDDYEARDKKRKELGSILGDDVTLSQAMNEDWSVDRAKLHALERRLPRSPLADLSTSEGAPRKHDVMEAAIMLNAGNSDEDTAALYGEKVVDVALSSGMRGYGLHALCYDVMAAANMPFTPGIFTNQTIRDAFRADRDIILAGQSLYSLTGILSNIANKFLLQGFNSVEQEWRKICAIDSVKDFKEQTFYRLTADAEYAEIGKGEAIPSAEMDEEEFTNSAKTYGKLFAVDRKTLVNDDLNAIRKSLRLHLGRGAGLKMNLIIWGQWVAAANVGSGKFFHTSHSDRGPNYKAGADTALSIESLAVAEKMFLDQVDSNDVPMDVEPTRIVVSTGNKTFADELFLFNTTEGGSTSTKKALTRHPYAGKFQVVCSKYLNKSVFGTDASDVAWYLAADPEALGVGAMQVVFLNGKQTPTIESSDADFDTLGIKMRGYHDFGAKLMEKACVVRMKGEA